MTMKIVDGVLHLPEQVAACIRAKGTERPDFLTDYTLIDVETTGLSASRDRITELGGLKVRGGEVVATYSELVKFPGKNEVPAFLTRLNGIDAAKILADGVPVDRAIHDFRSFIGADVIIGYNVDFDLNFVYDLTEAYHQPRLTNDYVDILRLARAFYPQERHNRLIDCMKRMDIAESQEHRGLDDCLDTKKVYDYLQNHLNRAQLVQIQHSLKNVDLLTDELPVSALAFDPVARKSVVFEGTFYCPEFEFKTILSHLGATVQPELTNQTDLVLLSDVLFADRRTPILTEVRKRQREGQRVRCWSQSFFLNRLDEWARH